MQNKQEKIEVELEPKMIKGKAQAFFQGELDENDREVWVWLPISQIEVIGDADSTIATVIMPYWLAHDKGLI